jgi:hypothetical protein
MAPTRAFLDNWVRKMTMNSRTAPRANVERPLPSTEIYNLAGERLAELVAEVDLLRGVVADSVQGTEKRSDLETVQQELEEAERRADACRYVMEMTQRRIEAEENEVGTKLEVAWEAAAETLRVASREIRDLRRRRAEFAFELYVQERMTASEAEARIEQIEARLGVLIPKAERAELALAVMEAREDRALEEIGKRPGADEERRLRQRVQT